MSHLTDEQLIAFLKLSQKAENNKALKAHEVTELNQMYRYMTPNLIHEVLQLREAMREIAESPWSSNHYGLARKALTADR